MAARKSRSDTVGEALTIAQSADKAIHPPAHVPLDETDVAFFASVVGEFARAEWTAHALEIAAMLARDMADMNAAQIALREQGEVVDTPKGGRAVNPLRTVVQTLSGSILSKRRSLQLNARAREGEARDAGKRKAAHKRIEDEASSEDDLIARPTH